MKAIHFNPDFKNRVGLNQDPKRLFPPTFSNRSRLREVVCPDPLGGWVKLFLSYFKISATLLNLALLLSFTVYYVLKWRDLEEWALFTRLHSERWINHGCCVLIGWIILRKLPQLLSIQEIKPSTNHRHTASPLHCRWDVKYVALKTVLINFM